MKPVPMKKTNVKVPKCRTEAQCEQISKTLKDAYNKGRRYRKLGATRAK